MWGLVLMLIVGAMVCATRPPMMILVEPFVRPYFLPEALKMKDGRKVDTAKMWITERRPEVLEIFRTQVYGRAPGRPAGMTFDKFEEDRAALGGIAVRKQVRVNFMGEPDGPGMDLLIYLPAKHDKPVPLFLILNFSGNQGVNADPGIRPGVSRSSNTGLGVRRMSEGVTGRGAASRRYPIDKILERGYGFATANYDDIDPDFDDGFKNGVQGSFDGPGPRPKDAWGSIAAWAWGMSRALDYLETDPEVDAKRVAAAGHSRLGKTALWAGAEDRRFAMVFASGSGCMGAALSRRMVGETLVSINHVFPHWFCENFHAYSLRADCLPIDQHELIALIAPRPVYLSGAEQDWWADPLGEFAAAKAASPVFELLGAGKFPGKCPPNLYSPVVGSIGFHIREGGHDLTEYDWERAMDFADEKMK